LRLWLYVDFIRRDLNLKSKNQQKASKRKFLLFLKSSEKYKIRALKCGWKNGIKNHMQNSKFFSMVVIRATSNPVPSAFISCANNQHLRKKEFHVMLKCVKLEISSLCSTLSTATVVSTILRVVVVDGSDVVKVSVDVVM
jgi:hypothetical protein